MGLIVVIKYILQHLTAKETGLAITVKRLIDVAMPMDDDFNELDPGMEQQIHRTTISPNPGDAQYELLNTISDLKGVHPNELPPFYDNLDSLVKQLFKHAPEDTAQVELLCSYAGYRIRITQDGQLTLRSIDHSSET